MQVLEHHQQVTPTPACCYSLPAADRQALIAGCSLNPTAEVSHQQLLAVERQRQAFIAIYGSEYGHDKTTQ